MQFFDAILIRFTGEDGCVHNIIVDGGEISSTKYCYTDRLKKKLEALFGGGESIDLWVITHIDNDHIGGLYNFLNDTEFFEEHHEQLKEVWMNYGGEGDYYVQRMGEIGYKDGKKLRDLLKEKQVCVKQGIKAGYKATISDATIAVVAPNDGVLKRYIEWWNDNEFHENIQTADGLIKGGEWDYDKKFKDFNLALYEEDTEVKNNSSIAFVLSYHGLQMLFASDSCASILQGGLSLFEKQENGKLKLDLMHIPHHGSCRNSSFAFFESIECPRYVITGNGTNRYQLPDKETIARLITANTSGCELHFTQMNSKLEEIFEGDECGNLKVFGGANFIFE